MNAYLSRKNCDHQTEQRQQAIAALSGKIDSEDRSTMTVAASACIVAFICAVVGAICLVTR